VKNESGSLHRVARVVRKYVPPTLRRTHSLFRSHPPLSIWPGNLLGDERLWMEVVEHVLLFRRNFVSTSIVEDGELEERSIFNFREISHQFLTHHCYVSFYSTRLPKDFSSFHDMV